MNPKLLYDFSSGATASLVDKLIEIRFKFKSRFELKEVVIERNNPNIHLDNGQIWFKDDEQNAYRMRWYLKRFKKRLFNSAPKIHLIECITYRSYSNFAVTNRYLNDYFAVDESILYRNQDLEICKNCIKELNRKLGTRLWNKDWNEVILEFEDNEQTKVNDLRPDGYTINWNQISEALRSSRDYTCENCHLKIENIAHRYFMQTHHKNRDKTNNQRSNLQCLCVYCHSRVDEVHIRNFGTPGNRKLLKEFRNNYGHEFKEWLWVN